MYKSVAEIFAATFVLMAGGQPKPSTMDNTWKAVQRDFYAVGKDMRWAVNQVSSGKK